MISQSSESPDRVASTSPSLKLHTTSFSSVTGGDAHANSQTCEIESLSTGSSWEKEGKQLGRERKAAAKRWSSEVQGRDGLAPRAPSPPCAARFPELPAPQASVGTGSYSAVYGRRPLLFKDVGQKMDDTVIIKMMAEGLIK